MRRSGSRLPLILAAAFAALAPCASAEADFFTPQTIQRFAPLLVVQKDERDGPASAQWFLERSALRFSESGLCSNETLHAGHWSRAAVARLGLLVPPASRWHYIDKEPLACHHNGARLTATEHTRPYDSNRPAGLAPEEGFFLDFGGVNAGMPFTKEGDDHELKTAAPIYYDDGELLDSAGSARHPRVAYITYWFFYAYNDAPAVPFLANHQGDWENMSLFFEQAAGGADWVLRRVAYAAHGAPKARTAACADAVEATEPLACPAPRVAWQGTARLVGFVAKGDHATYASPGDHHLYPEVDDHTSAFGSGFSWPAWQSMLPLESQPWAGFCGAWGRVGGSVPGTGIALASDRTGPLGPGCLDERESQRKTGRPSGWGASRSSPADREARPGAAIGVGL